MVRKRFQAVGIKRPKKRNCADSNGSWKGRKRSVIYSKKQLPSSRKTRFITQNGYFILSTENRGFKRFARGRVLPPSCALEGFLRKKNCLFVAFLHFLCNTPFGWVVLTLFDHVAVFPVLPSSPRLHANGEIRKVVIQRKED